MSEKKYLKVEDLQSADTDLYGRFCLTDWQVKSVRRSHAKLLTYTPAEIMAGMWRPVSKPPNNMRDVLVTAFWHEKWQTLVGWYADGKWYICVNGDNKEWTPLVAAWMEKPLPQPPKEVEH